VAGTESAGDIQRGGEVRAGGRPGEDALAAAAWRAVTNALASGMTMTSS